MLVRVNISTPLVRALARLTILTVTIVLFYNTGAAGCAAN